MVTSTPAPAAAIARTTRTGAVPIADAEVRALLALLEQLDEGEWDKPTDCEAWRVRDMVAHVVGAAQESVRPSTMARHLVRSRTTYRSMGFLDGLNEAQIDDRRTWSPSQLLEAARELLPKAVRARARALPARGVPVPMGEPLGMSTLAYLNDVIYIRDLWMHRVDICRATDREHVRGAQEHEIIIQVIADLARGWGGPAVILHIHGPAAGSYRIGNGAITGEADVTDDVEWLRVLSGRRGVAPLSPRTGSPPIEQLAAATVAF